MKSQPFGKIGAYAMAIFVSLQLSGTPRCYKTAVNKPMEIFRQETIKGEGFLKAQLIDNALILEIPMALLDKPMLVVRHEAKNHNMQIYWRINEGQLLMETHRVKSLSGAIIPIRGYPERQTFTIGVFPIMPQRSEPHGISIDMTDFFINGQLDALFGLNETIIRNQSFIEGLSHLEDELIVHTNRVISTNKGKEINLVHFSLFLLPEPMKPRLFDYRMGFFSEDGTSSINHLTMSSQANISRWRLEKLYKDNSMSVPVKPIRFRISEDVPKKWRPYVKAGILEWLPAFEAAGFKDAIKVLDSSDIDGKAINHSVSHSMVRWGHLRNVRGFENGSGSTVSKIIDLRTGEILKSDILLGTSLQDLADKYFIRCAPMDSRAHHYPFEDSLMGELVQSLVAHESGHAFGIMDANHGEYAYPFDYIRNPKWLETMGHTPSIMTYARHNYVAQPEDQIPPSLLIQKVGPTDIYNIRWAYTEFSENGLHGDEALLESIVREQDVVPWYRYNKTRYEVIGPSSTDEVVDNDDPIRSTKLGLKNMRRMLQLLPIVNQSEKDHALMERLYDKTLNLWYQEMRHVMSMVGGYSIQYKSGSQAGNIYNPIPLPKQDAALDYLLVSILNPPDWLLRPEFKLKTGYSTHPDKLMELQLKLVSELIGTHRMKRMEYMEQDLGFLYVSKNVLSKLNNALFQEMYGKRVSVDPRKQEIQMFLVNALILGMSQNGSFMNAEQSSTEYSSHSKSLFMDELLNIQNVVAKKLNSNMDKSSFGHLNLLLNRIRGFIRGE